MNASFSVHHLHFDFQGTMGIGALWDLTQVAKPGPHKKELSDRKGPGSGSHSSVLIRLPLWEFAGEQELEVTFSHF